MKVSARKNQKGAVAIVYALTVVVSVGFAGLAIDVGYLQWEKRRIQSAADAAAMGGLRELELGKSDLLAAGQNDAALNGFKDGQDNTTVKINNPPTSGAYANDSLAVEGIVQRKVPTFFMIMFGQKSVTISARAVAKTGSGSSSSSATGASGSTGAQGSIGGCIFALDPSQKAALEINGTSMSLNMSCSMIAESTNSAAFKMDSGVTVNMSNKAKVGVVGPGGTSSTLGSGGWFMTGQATIMDTSVTPNVSENPVNILNPGDPFVNSKEPDISSLTAQSTSLPSNHTLNPGIYCGGINWSNIGGATITFNPGIYVMGGGGFSLSSSAAIKGAGITIYNTSGKNAGCGSGTSVGDISLTGQSSVNLSAPTSGATEGFLFFEDRTLGSISTTEKIVGGANSTFDGALYFKHGALTFAGNNSTNGYMVIVANTIKINGTTTIGNNYSSLQPGSNFPMAPLATGGGLVE